MKRLSPSLIGLGVVPAVFGMLLGCGGGGGGSAAPGIAARSTFNSKTRLVQATRVSRTLLALTGLGRTITRAAAPPAQASFSISGRQRQILAVLSSHRNAGSRSAASLDPATGLYYTTNLLANGSGQQLLYTDQALTQPAGTITISTPKWAIFPSGSYPANLSENYNITAGSFAGVSGTLQATVGDAAFTTGRCVLALTDQEGDAASGDFTLSGEEISGKCKCKFKNGDTCDGTDFTDSGGNIDQTFNWPDDGLGAITTEPDGISTQSYTNPDATPASPDLTGTVQPDGADTIETSSGDSSSVNVDPGSDNSGDNGSGDGGTGGGSGGTGGGSGGTGGGSGGTGGGSGGTGGGSGGGSGGS